jgi:hypothetical protein
MIFTEVAADFECLPAKNSVFCGNSRQSENRHFSVDSDWSQCRFFGPARAQNGQPTDGPFTDFYVINQQQQNALLPIIFVKTARVFIPAAKF